MHGTISLDSNLDQGTKATFSIPFAKAQFSGSNAPPLVDISAFPDRLQSELSLSQEAMSVASPRHLSAGDVSPAIGAPGSISQLYTLTEEQRRQFHVLVVEDNTINQQIALKTIRGLGFSVSGVWNGKEALDYLLKAGTPEDPMPSLILMDVQMPVMDGYRATHLLRHHSPYDKLPHLQAIPIIAMTASAIQGDREKCEKAGMDDYLAKPVRRPLLERMIVKWLGGEMAEKKRQQKSTPPDHPLSATTSAEHGSECPGSEPSHETSTKQTTEAVPPGRLSRQASAQKNAMIAAQPSTSTENDHSSRRAAAEEYASALRDDKLLAATANERPDGHVPLDTPVHSGNSPLESYQRNSSSEDTPVLALTQENMRKLNDGGDKKARRNELDDNFSTNDTHSTVEPPSDDREVGSSSTGDQQSMAVQPSTTTPANLHTDMAMPRASALKNDKSPRTDMARKISDWSQSTVKPGT